MSEPIRLAPKPTVSDEIREAVLHDLREAIALADAGEIEASIIILKRADGYWLDYRSGVDGFPDAIGRLEIIKHSWIIDFLKEPTR